MVIQNKKGQNEVTMISTQTIIVTTTTGTHVGSRAQIDKNIKTTNKVTKSNIPLAFQEDKIKKYALMINSNLLQDKNFTGVGFSYTANQLFGIGASATAISMHPKTPTPVNIAMSIILTYRGFEALQYQNNNFKGVTVTLP